MRAAEETGKRGRGLTMASKLLQNAMILSPGVEGGGQWGLGATRIKKY
jgi:hypothetical protein